MGNPATIGRTRIQVIVHGILKVRKHHSFSLLSVQYFYPDTLQQMSTGFPQATWVRMNGDFLSLDRRLRRITAFLSIFMHISAS